MDHAAARDEMVRAQLERRGVSDPRVLAAMRAVPRELFVNAGNEGEAYADRALPIGSGQTISQPYMVAVMTEALALDPTARVLEIGTGSGYQAAVLSRLAREVVTVERRADLAARARARLDQLGCTNVHVVVGDGSAGYPPGAPFEAILVTAGAPRVPEALTALLVEGGRLVIPVGDAWQQELLTIVRRGDALATVRGESCVFVPLVGRHGWEGAGE
jgi:protein-L-isoaspartate(D-aspartate) O-methyltransferase